MKNLKTKPSMLLIGIGNSGRGDDGLGWQFVEKINSLGLDFLDCEFRYQLQVEDAVLISGYDIVIFVDATQERFAVGFQVSRCIAASHSFFSTHEQAPAAIVCLANTLYEKFPRAYTLFISGKDWNLQTSLSREAENNLEAAESFFLDYFLPTIQPRTVFSYS